MRNRLGPKVDDDYYEDDQPVGRGSVLSRVVVEQKSRDEVSKGKLQTKMF